MRRALTIVSGLLVLAVIAGGAVEVIHLRSQVGSLRAEQRKHLTFDQNATELLTRHNQDIGGLATDLADLRARVAGDERGSSLRSTGINDDAIQRLNELARSFTNYCLALDQHLDLDTRAAVAASCPTYFTLAQ